jgi:hypothetical protein
LTSTPNKPDSLFHKIERNEIFKDFFKKIFLHYTLGLGKIYDSAFIEREKNKAYFQREYLAYAGRPGNLFSQDSNYNKNNMTRLKLLLVNHGPELKHRWN